MFGVQKQNMQTNILLFGETGNGKSSLGNTLLGIDAFRVSADIKSETKVTFGRKGVGANSNLFVIDTPGLQDSSGADKQHMIQLVQYIKEHKELNAIIVVFNYQQVRFPYNIQTMLKLFCNIFPMKDVGDHIALVFTNSFTKRGLLNQEQKYEKLQKILPEFKRVIEESSGSKISANITTGFVDMEPKDGLDENGKMDLDRIITWASFLPNLNVEVIKTPEPDVKIETQDFNEMKIEGEYIIKTIIKKEREVYCQLDGSISYGEWKEKERKEERIINPEVEKIKKLNLDNEQMIKKIQEENEKTIKKLKGDNEKMQEKAHKDLLEIIASNKKNEEEMIRLRRLQSDDDRIRREEAERRKDEKELKKAKEEERRRNNYEKRYLSIKNTAKSSHEDKNGECAPGKTQFSAGITEEDNKFIKEDRERVFQKEKKLLGYQTETFEKTFPNKIIVGWKLKSDHDNDYGGKWERKSAVLGTSSYSFSVSSFFGRGCNWKLSIWYIDDEFPLDFEY